MGRAVLGAPRVGAGAPSRTRRAPWGATAVVVVLMAMVSGGSVGLAVHALGRGPALGGAMRPGLPADAADRPLSQPAPAPGGEGGYALLRVEDDGSGTPVRWDPCRPIHYVVRPDGAPPGGNEALRASLADISRATGLTFVYDGPTTEPPRQDRPSIQTVRYGWRWAPVLIVWTDPQEYAAVSGYAGLGGPVAVSGTRPGTTRYVSGVVLLNRDHLTTVARWDGGAERLQAVVEHELGHLVGLDHVDDTAQLMNPRPGVHTTTLAPGDLRGMAAIADGPCYRDF